VLRVWKGGRGAGEEERAWVCRATLSHPFQSCDAFPRHLAMAGTLISAYSRGDHSSGFEAVLSPVLTFVLSPVLTSVLKLL